VHWSTNFSSGAQAYFAVQEGELTVAAELCREAPLPSWGVSSSRSSTAGAGTVMAVMVSINVSQHNGRHGLNLTRIRLAREHLLLRVSSPEVQASTV